MPGYRINKTPSPYNASELMEIDFEQTADVLYLAHVNHVPTKLIRSSNTSWSFTPVTFGPLIAAPATCAATATVDNTDAANSNNAYFPQPATYVVTAYNEDTGQESRASPSSAATNDLGLKRNSNVITWAAVTGATGYKIYKSENTQNLGYIGTTTSLTFTDVNIGPDLSQGPPLAFSPFAGASDYPGTVTFHEQRSMWGRSINRPNGVWASRSADYENMDFSRPSVANDAFVIGLVANKVNSVNQLVSYKLGLIALTSNNIFLLEGANDDYIAASPPPRVRPEVSRGASQLNPIVIDNIIFYQTARLSSVRTIGYDFMINGVKTDDITVFSPHLFQGHTIVDWAYAEKPATCIWAVRDDGKLLCLTWDQPQQVWGWTLCETDGLFKAVCVIFEQGEDRAYFAVQRVINGVTKLFVERMASELWTDQSDACYLDCAKTYINAVATATVDRLDHLEGRTVSALVDGNVVNGLVVTNGAVTLPNAGMKITIGIPYTALIETLPLAMQTPAGWNIAKTQQVGKAIISVVNTRGIEAGPDLDNMFPVKQRDQEPLGAPTNLFTGYVEAELAGTSQQETVLIVRSSDPLPMHISAILVEPLFAEDD